MKKSKLIFDEGIVHMKNQITESVAEYMQFEKLSDVVSVEVAEDTVISKVNKTDLFEICVGNWSAVRPIFKDENNIRLGYGVINKSYTDRIIGEVRKVSKNDN